MSEHVALRPRGPFSLAAAAAFLRGFAPVDAAEPPGGGLALALRVEGSWEAASAVVRQARPDEVVELELDGPPPAVDQVARILALDVDGTGFAAVGERDPVVGALQRDFAGLRPVHFGSPYEAAAWALLSQRTRMAHAAALRRRLTAERGERGAFPAPAALAALPDAVPGLPALKAQRLRALGEAALAGDLATARLRAVPRGEALDALRALPGIGPFGAELVLLRGAADPDAFPEHEPRLHGAMRAAYGLSAGAGVEELRAIADGWRPFRSWVAFLLRRRPA